jgi:hypothetical protein
MKLQTTPLIWLHILGFGFQQAARYHIDANKTLFATVILPVRERLECPQAINFPFKESIDLSKFASAGSQKPI